jgi:superfamily II DNA/RNA helicase
MKRKIKIKLMAKSTAASIAQTSSISCGAAALPASNRVDILVSTPQRLLAMIEESRISLKSYPSPLAPHGHILQG